MTRIKVAMVAVIVSLLVAGCNVRTQEFNQRVMQDLPLEVQQVQTALDQYMEQTPVLPIKSTQGHSFYEKYVLDLKQLDAFLGSRPANSFEKGGSFVFVVANPGEGKNYQVRVLDLRVTEELRDLNRRVDHYQRSNGEWPQGEREGEEFYRLDYKKLGIDPVTIPSPYSGQGSLSVLINADGELFLDYRAEVMQLLEKEDKDTEKKADLRERLWEDSVYVPAYSPLMEEKDGEPILSTE
ncbi:hypothetical protein [Desmospora activa]|uniref:Lipoprotein n=1 Tax=Desmospora activa DSM 45169 TaxID=1121389 RepID=A0A2T4Z9V7_9BACL|nr:hypothetical protein [Desmospora activa]PTM58671.1 hypothetical protein C8J48_1258 [Desmospora activa DSM 45169]